MDEYTDSLNETHNDQVKELEEKINQLTKINENLKAESRNKTNVFEFLLKARDDRFKELERKTKEIETENEKLREEIMKLLADSTKAPLGNLSPPPSPECMEIVEFEDEEKESPNDSTQSANISDIYIDDGFQFTSGTVQSAFNESIDPYSLRQKLNSEAKIHRMIIKVHLSLGKTNWDSKEIKIDQLHKGVMGNQFFITCPECLKKIPTSPILKSTKGERENFSIIHYKKHIKLKHC